MILAWFLCFGEVFIVWILSSLFAVAVRTLAGTNIAGKSFLRETNIIVVIIVLFFLDTTCFTNSGPAQGRCGIGSGA